MVAPWIKKKRARAREEDAAPAVEAAPAAPEPKPEPVVEAAPVAAEAVAEAAEEEAPKPKRRGRRKPPAAKE